MKRLNKFISAFLALTMIVTSLTCGFTVSAADSNMTAVINSKPNNCPLDKFTVTLSPTTIKVKDGTETFNTWDKKVRGDVYVDASKPSKNDKDNTTYIWYSLSWDLKDNGSEKTPYIMYFDVALTKDGNTSLAYPVNNMIGADGKDCSGKHYDQTLEADTGSFTPKGQRIEISHGLDINFHFKLPVVTESKLWLLALINVQTQSGFFKYNNNRRVNMYVDIHEYNNTALQTLYNQVKGYNADDYYKGDSAWLTFDTARSKAATMLSECHSTQAEIDTAKTNLSAAISKLQRVENVTVNHFFTLPDKSTKTIQETPSEFVGKPFTPTLLASGEGSNPTYNRHTYPLPTVSAVSDKGDDVLTINYWTVDLADINSAISSANECVKNLANYTSDSMAVLQEKLKNANDAVASVSTTQAQIDTAAKDLKAAISGLVPSGTKKKLGDAIKSCPSDFTKYTPKSVQNSNVESILDSAKKAFNDAATTQAQADDLADQLNAAVGKLVLKANKDALKTQLGTYEYQKLTDTYTPKSLEDTNMVKITNDAVALMKDDNASQADVDASVTAIKAAVPKLVKPGYKGDLIADRKEITDEQGDLSDYTQESLKSSGIGALVEEMDRVIADVNASQTDVDNTINDFYTIYFAHSGELKKGIKKSDLSAAIAAVGDLSQYTPKSLTDSNMSAIIDEAKKIIADDTATQAAVDKETTVVKNAAKKLVKKADKKDLEAAIKSVPADGSIYTKSTWTAVTEALKKANQELKDDNASQTDVTNATNILKMAVGCLIVAPTITANKDSGVIIDKLKEKFNGTFTKTTFDDILKNKIKISNGELKLYDKDGNLINDKLAIVGTGMTMKLWLNNEVASQFNVVIFGDVTGDGKVDINDKKDIFAEFRNEKQAASDAAKSAEDLNHDGVVDIADMLLLEYKIADDAK